MGLRLKTIGAFAPKVGRVLVSGALALSLTPAVALADTGLQAAPADLASDGAASGQLSTQHYEYVNNSGKAMIDKDGNDPLKSGVKLVSKGGNVYKYMGYAHSDDGAHYKAYSLYTEITTDDEGVITAIDLTSGNDTFAGMWGYARGKGAAPIDGYLPDGVNFQASENSDGTWTPVLSGGESLGLALTKVELISTNADGTKDAADTGDFTSETYAGDMAKIAIDPKSNVNLVRCTYTGAGEKMPFATYFSVGEKEKADLADRYIDNVVGETVYTDNPTEGYTTNRDRWTHIMGSVALRELASWGAAIGDPAKVTQAGLDGEVAVVDTVSGATKTAVPFVAALNQARSDGYVKGVSENVAFTIDKASKLDEVDISANPKDRTTVEIDAEDHYVANVVFPFADTLKRNDNHGVTLDKISVYALGGQKVGTQGMMALAKQNSGSEEVYKALAEYTPESEKLNPVTSEGKGSGSGQYSGKGQGSGSAQGSGKGQGSEAAQGSGSAQGSGKGQGSETAQGSGKGQGSSETTTSYSWAPKDQKAGEYVTAIDNDNVKFDYEVSDQALKVTAKNKDITHVVMTYTLGHGTIAIAYDLENMAKVPGVSAALAAASSADAKSVSDARAAYEALPYDVRPFTTGIGNLEEAEAALVSAQLSKLEATSPEDAVSSARSAYDALDAAAKAKVETAAYAKLDAAEKAAAEAKAEAEKAAAEKAAAEKAEAEKAAGAKAAKEVKAGQSETVSGQDYKVVKVATAKAAGTVTFTKAKNAKSVTVPATVTLDDGLTYKVTKVAANSFTASKIRSVTIGANVNKIAAGAFKGSKATSVSVKGTGLSKKSVKNCFKGGKVATVKVPAKKLKAYKKNVFTKANTATSAKKLTVKK